MADRIRAQGSILRSVLDSMGEGVIVVDEDGRYILVNHAARRLGVNPDVERPVAAWSADSGIFDPDTLAHYETDQLPINRALTGESVDDDVAFVRFSGRPEGMWIRSSARPLQAENHGQGGAVTVFRDVTEQVQAREELSERAEALSRSNSALEEFAYVTSHDLQQPVRTMSSYAQLLREDYSEVLDPVAQKYLAFIIDGAQRLHELIRDLLAFARAGQTDADLEQVNLNDVIVNVRENLGQQIAESHAVIECGKLPTVPGRRSLLTQIFQNLIGNAIKYRGEASPIVRVQAIAHARVWLVSVADNGIGIEPDKREQIFRIFQRLHTRTEYTGTGIGLAITRRIVEHYGGRIWVDASGQGGSIFEFTWPREVVGP